MAQLPAEVLALLVGQDRLVTRAQLSAAGVTEATIRWNAGRRWRVLLPGVYLVGRAEPSLRQRLVAGLLWAGPDSVVASSTAARVHGLRGLPPDPRVHLVVPSPQRSRTNTFAFVRRSKLTEDAIVRLGPVRLSSPARACIDAAVALPSPDQRAALLIEAVQREIAALEDLAEWMHRLSRRDARRVRPAVEAAGSGAWSLPEAELLDLVASSGVLPVPWANPRLVDARGAPLLTPDVWFDDVAMAVMVHSRAYHEGSAWDQTVERDGGLVATGVVVAGVTPHRIRTDPRGVLTRLERTYLAARGRPRPPVTATATAPAAGSVAAPKGRLTSRESVSGRR